MVLPVIRYMASVYPCTIFKLFLLMFIVMPKAWILINIVNNNSYLQKLRKESINCNNQQFPQQNEKPTLTQKDYIRR